VVCPDHSGERSPWSANAAGSVGKRDWREVLKHWEVGGRETLSNDRTCNVRINLAVMEKIVLLKPERGVGGVGLGHSGSD